jgi:hypothetical protein
MEEEEHIPDSIPVRKTCDRAFAVKREFPTTWNYGYCGGPLIHGTRLCKKYDGQFMCYCLEKPKLNYLHHFYLLMEDLRSQDFFKNFLCLIKQEI